jgi:hypothetical protein
VLNEVRRDFKLELRERLGSDGEGITSCLGPQVEVKVEMVQIIVELEKKISAATLLTFW